MRRRLPASNTLHPLRDTLAEILPLFPRRFQLPVPFGVNLMLATGEHILRRDIADGTVQAGLIVMLDVALREASRIIQRKRCPRRMHSLFSDLCQRSIFPFDWG